MDYSNVKSVLNTLQNLNFLSITSICDWFELKFMCIKPIYGIHLLDKPSPQCTLALVRNHLLTKLTKLKLCYLLGFFIAIILLCRAQQSFSVISIVISHGNPYFY